MLTDKTLSNWLVEFEGEDIFSCDEIAEAIERKYGHPHVFGIVYAPTLNANGQSHSWNIHNDNPSIIIDGTADQFGIGKKGEVIFLNPEDTEYAWYRRA